MNCRTSPMTRGWYTARELAGSPGMPGTVQGVNARAKSQGWEAKKRKGRGGGREYALASLPLETRLSLMDMASRQTLAASAQPLRQLAAEHRAMADQLERFAKAIEAEGKAGGRP